MTGGHWKAFERFCAEFIGGKRYPANTGERVDCESELAIIQAKLKQNLSHQELSALAEEMQRIGHEKNKLGAVIHKVPGGKGHPTPALITMTCTVFDEWFSLRANPSWLASCEHDEESDGG